jgi:hypothetical protein
MSEPQFSIEVIDDPIRNAESRAILAAFDKNVDWLSTHWSDVLPAAYGKYVAVAGQQAFIADDWREAERLAREKHPDDKGLYLRYLNPQQGIRRYGHRRGRET